MARSEEKIVRVGARLERQKQVSRMRKELEPITREQVERLAKVGVPKRLSSSELDPITGTITWPVVLAEPKFSRNRQQVESFFSQRAQPGFAASFGAYQDVLNAIGEMRAKLKSQVRHTDFGHYTAARRFLESLAYEVRQ